MPTGAMMKPSIEKWDLQQLRLPQIQFHRTKNGWPVYFKEDHRLPIISLRLILSGGAESVDKGGLTSLRYELIGHHFQTNWERYTLSGDLTQGTTERNTVFSLDSLASEWRECCQVFKDLLSLREVDEQFASHLRSVRIQNMMHNRHNPRYLCRWAAQELIFDGSILKHGVHGSVDSLNSITIDDLNNALRNQIASGHFIFTGSFDIGTISKWIEDNLPQCLPYRRPEVILHPHTGYYYVHAPSSQSSVHLIRTLSNEQRLSIANEILSLGIGEMFTSRLNQQLRVKQGITYGITSNVWEYNKQNLFICHGTVDSHHQEQAVHQIIQVLDGAEKSWTTTEVDIIVQHLSQHLLEMSSTCYDLADLVEHWIGTDNTLEEFNQLADTLREVTVQQIIEAGRVLSNSTDTSIITCNEPPPNWKALELQKVMQ